MDEENQSNESISSEKVSEEKIRAVGSDIMDELQALIGEQIEKYHEYRIKRDQGQETGSRPRPGRGLGPPVKSGYKKKFPQALLQQYMSLN